MVSTLSDFISKFRLRMRGALKEEMADFFIEVSLEAI